MPYDIDPKTQLAIGPKLAASVPAPFPEAKVLEGRYCRLEPLEVRHAPDLYECSSPDDADTRFRYLFDEPPSSIQATEAWIRDKMADKNYLYYAIVDKSSGRVEGRQSLMRIDAVNQCIENGNVRFATAPAKTQLDASRRYTLVLDLSRHAVRLKPIFYSPSTPSSSAIVASSGSAMR